MVGKNCCTQEACKHDPGCLKRCRVHWPHWGAWRKGVCSFSRELQVGGPEVTQASDSCRGEQVPAISKSWYCMSHSTPWQNLQLGGYWAPV